METPTYILNTYIIYVSSYGNTYKYNEGTDYKLE